MDTFRAGEFEHVCLSSEEPDAPGAIPAGAPVTARLEQPARRGARLSVAILGDSHLGVRWTTNRGATREFVLGLEFVDPDPTRPPARAWWGLAGSLALASALLAVPAWVWAGVVPTALLAALSGMLAAALASAAVAADRTWGRWVLLSRHGRVPLLELSGRRPSRRRVREFLVRLQDASGRVATGRTPAEPRSLRNEMREHRRLLDERVLRPEVYAAARDRILAAHG